MLPADVCEHWEPLKLLSESMCVSGAGESYMLNYLRGVSAGEDKGGKL